MLCFLLEEVVPYQVLEEGLMIFQDGSVSHLVKMVYCVKLRSKESVFTRDVLKQSRLIVSPPSRRRNAPAPGYAGQDHANHQNQFTSTNNHRTGPGNNHHAAAAPYPYGHLSVCKKINCIHTTACVLYRGIVNGLLRKLRFCPGDQTTFSHFFNGL